MSKAALALAVLLAAPGCTSTIAPPPAPADPVTVYLLLEARHRGLVLPADDGALLEYGFGDWDWYALNEDGWHDAFDTVLWPGGGALGRRHTGARDGATLRALHPDFQLHDLAVEREAMAALRAGLDAPFLARAADAHFNPRYGMTFVPVNDGFWCLFNCNDAVAGWLEQLGCEVSWAPVRIGLQFVE